MWPTWVPDKPLPDDESGVVKGVLDVIALDHPTADQLLECGTVSSPCPHDQGGIGLSHASSTS